MDESEIRRQAEILLAGLKSAGVGWLPKHKHLPPRPRAIQTETAPPAAAVAAIATPSTFRPAPAPPIAEPAMPATAAPDRRTPLELLVAEVAACTRCPELTGRIQTVFGDGQPGAEICFLGEAPGADEDKQGKPFVGAAGKLLNDIIAACGLKREEVYICNILKCRPPGNRTPLPEEAENCKGFLRRQLDIVKPKYIVCLGSTAAKNLLNSTKSLGDLRNTFHDFNGIPVLVTYHPAYLLPHRNPAKKREVWDDMKMLLTKMGRPIPPPKKT